MPSRNIEAKVIQGLELLTDMLRWEHGAWVTATSFWHEIICEILPDPVCLLCMEQGPGVWGVLVEVPRRVQTPYPRPWRPKFAGSAALESCPPGHGNRAEGLGWRVKVLALQSLNTIMYIYIYIIYTYNIHIHIYIYNLHIHIYIYI